MKPAISSINPTVATLTQQELHFIPTDERQLPLVAHYLSNIDSRTCDYTIGGIYLWIDVFDYELAEVDNILFIRGRQENDLTLTAFSLPLCEEFRLAHAVSLLAEMQQPLRFSAIPEDRLHLFAEIGFTYVNELGPDWSDYIYRIEPIATLTGNAMKRKRNHVNRFIADNPHHIFTEMNAKRCMTLLSRIGHDGSFMGQAEFRAVMRMLERWDTFKPYLIGRMLLDERGEVAAFTICEIKGDTLHVHVEKADHTVSGSGEMVAHALCAEMKSKYPELEFVNRQDNAGDDGLRIAKESWHPERLLPKFNVTY